LTDEQIFDVFRTRGGGGRRLEAVVQQTTCGLFAFVSGRAARSSPFPSWGVSREAREGARQVVDLLLETALGYGERSKMDVIADESEKG
jgi:hypothetical protein